MTEDINNTESINLSIAFFAIKDGHRIVEIGCVELDDLIPVNKFHTYLNP